MIFLLSLLAAAWRPVTLTDPMGVDGPMVVLGAQAAENPSVFLQAACYPDGPVIVVDTRYTYIPRDTTRIRVSHGAPVPGVESKAPPEVQTYGFFRGDTPTLGMVSGFPIFSAMIRRPGRTVFELDGRRYSFDLDAGVLAPWFATCVAKGKVAPGYLGDVKVEKTP